MPNPACLAPVLALSLLLPPSLAQEVDVDMLLGDSFSGAIDAPGDVDVARLLGVAGQAVTLHVKPVKGAALVPTLDLLLADTLETVPGQQSKGQGALLKAVLPETGTYLLCVAASGDATGGYKLKSKGALPKSATKPDSEPGSEPGSAALKVDALAGSRLVATIRPAPGTQAEVGALTLTGPAGQVPLAPWMKSKGDKVLLQQVPLAEFGAYVLEAANAGDPHGELLITATVLKPKLGKLQLIEGDFVMQLDPGVPVNGTSPGGKLSVLGKLLDLSGQGLPASVQWSCENGTTLKSGSLKVKQGAFQGKLPLAEGDNCILLSANRGQASQHLDCTCNAGFVFGGPLLLSPGQLFAQEPIGLWAQMPVADADVNPQDVWLVQLDAAGGEAKLFRLFDDGNLVVGDTLAGDGLFSGFGIFEWPAVGLAQVRAVASRMDQELPARSEIHGLLVGPAPPAPTGHGRPPHVAQPPQGDPADKPILHPVRPAFDIPGEPSWKH